MSKRLIAIAGGIGSGKSVVSRIVSTMGFYVYDCDSEAKLLMDSSSEIKSRLRHEINHDVIDSNGDIDRERLAQIVFNDNNKLLTLNDIVHSAVRDDITSRFSRLPVDQPMFVETAILYQSKLDLMVDEVWEVIAPVDLRIERVMRRNSCTRECVVARIKAQEFEPETIHKRVFEVINDGVVPLLPRVEYLINRF